LLSCAILTAPSKGIVVMHLRKETMMVMKMMMTIISGYRDISVGIATGHGPDGQVLILGSGRFFLLHSVYIGSGAHPVMNYGRAIAEAVIR
jgi:hypothetical protein